MKIGTIVAIFNLTGNLPNSNDLLKIIEIGKDNSFITFLQQYMSSAGAAKIGIDNIDRINHGIAQINLSPEHKRYKKYKKRLINHTLLALNPKTQILAC